MGEHRKVSARFRQGLRGELKAWQSDGLITQEQSEAISCRYALDDLPKESVVALMFAIYLIGSALIACGVVSLVAWHWDEIPALAKVALLVVATLACHIGGFWLWKVRATRPLLGHGLVVLGTLVFGASIGLLAQIFNIHSNFYNGMAGWAIGALAMAYAADSVPNALIAIVTSFIYWVGWMGDNRDTLCLYPFLAAVGFVPLAYLRRSRWVFAAALLAIGISVVGAAGMDIGPLAAGLAAAGVGGLYSAWGIRSARSDQFDYLAPPAKFLGNLCLAIIAFLMSFRGMAEDVPQSLRYLGDHWTWLAPAGAALAAAVVVGASALALRPRVARTPMSPAVLVAALLLLAGLGATFLLYRDEINIRQLLAGHDHILLVVLANLALLVLAVGMIASGVTAIDRLDFWAGIVLIAVLIVSRFFEYETGLLGKGAAFLGCGVGLIVGGVAFENYVRRRRLVDA